MQEASTSNRHVERVASNSPWKNLLLHGRCAVAVAVSRANGAAVPQVSLTYDDAGNLVQDGSSEGDHKYFYDCRNR
jgi:hypothetical protein